MRTLENTRKTVKAIFLSGGLFAICTAAIGGTATAASLYEEVASDDRLTVFTGALEQAGMADILKQEGPYILFVPSDRAMANEGSAFLLSGVLLTPVNAGRLKDLLSYHIVPAERLDAEGINDEDLATMRGAPVHVTRYGNARMVNGWAAVTERRQADNGVIYVIDRLLIPTSPDMN
jgi:uncharacterized surface protein with fasciclin (FAS1) repeats